MTLKETILDESHDLIHKKMDSLQESLLNNMLDAVSLATTVFKSQQIDDPELCGDEKKEIAKELLFHNPLAFLTRFGSCLTNQHLELMEMFKTDVNSYDLEFIICQLKHQLSDNARKNLIKNRRFEALKRLENDGKYFSEEEMQGREPLLYHQLVGQFLSEREKVAKYKEANKTEIPSFSKFLMNHAEEAANENRLREQLATEDGCWASSDDEPPQPGSSKDPPHNTWGADWEDEEKDKKRKEARRKNKAKKLKITADEKQLLLQEFKTHLHTKFLDGLDADFDYSSVDGNPEYDCLQVRSQDEEEKYFDEETCDNTICTDTGVEDY